MEELREAIQIISALENLTLYWDQSYWWDMCI